jgi:hypothetical protein
LHSWSETNSVIVYDLFDVLLNLICKYFIENFSTYVLILLYPCRVWE